MAKQHGFEFDLKNKRGIAILVTCEYKGTENPLPHTKDDGDEMSITLGSDHLDYCVCTIRDDEATQQRIISVIQAAQRYLSKYDGGCKNDDGSYKTIIFAFSGHGGSDNEIDFIATVDGKTIFLSNIVGAFLGLGHHLINIPKLFFFDACRGNNWLTTALHKGDGIEAHFEVNYRIDYATIPEYGAYDTKSGWMCQIAQLLRDPKKPNTSLGDVMAEVKKSIYERHQIYPQQPETLDRLVTGPLRLQKKAMLQ